ncbi:MAG: hypothetical protein M3N19_04645, partial [Candidatus Eremiobacteraeota bacterium]|nr:hypothetical protein [Candidatus Eremiobacteraeota bacterium]
MQTWSRYFSLVLAAIFLSAMLPGTATASPAALNSFDEAWSKINDYTVVLKAHEISGGNTQDRVYNYFFRKPHQAKTDIVDGDGRGGGGVWNGGDQVSGHQGGFLSRFHLKVGLHDRRAVSIRGYTLPDGLFNSIVGHYRT